MYEWISRKNFAGRSIFLFRINLEKKPEKADVLFLSCLQILVFKDSRNKICQYQVDLNRIETELRAVRINCKRIKMLTIFSKKNLRLIAGVLLFVYVVLLFGGWIILILIDTLAFRFIDAWSKSLLLMIYASDSDQFSLNKLACLKFIDKMLTSHLNRFQ